jgi:hypothetical protein
MTDAGGPPSPRGGRTTPTGAKSGTQGERSRREASARRVLFALTLTGLVATTGLISAAGKPEVPVVASEGAGAPIGRVGSGRIVAEVPIGVTSGEGASTIVRIVAPDGWSPAPQVRTRATP